MTFRAPVPLEGRHPSQVDETTKNSQCVEGDFSEFGCGGLKGGRSLSTNQTPLETISGTSAHAAVRTAT